jgi:hypothetical protein
MSSRALQQPMLFGAVEAEGTGVESKPRALAPRTESGSSTATRADSQETEQRPTQGATFHASPPPYNLLHEVCAYCGKQIQPPGFVIPDFDDLGAFCDEWCADRRFRLFLEKGSD